MAPLPPVWDPSDAEDKLPLPFRMIDKVLWEIFDKAFKECTSRKDKKAAARTKRLAKSFTPQHQYDSTAPVASFCCSAVGGGLWIGSAAGEVQLVDSESKVVKAQLQPHTSSVLAVAAISLPDSGKGQLIASVSASQLCVHSLAPGDSQMLAVCEATTLPPGSQLQSPACIHLSPDCRHLALTSHAGQLCIFALPALPSPAPAASPASQPAAVLPPKPPAGAAGKVQPQEQAASSAPPAPLRLVNLLPPDSSRALLGLPSTAPLSECRMHWQAQGSSKRNEGLYTYWKGHNRLLLVALNAPAPPVFAPAATPAEKKPDAKAASAPKAAAKAAVDKATAGDAAVTAAAAKVKAAGDWVLPFGITCSHSSSDGSQLALGLADGSVVLWDDCLRGHSAVLPRLSAPVAALGFTSCQPHQLIACTAGGSVHITALASRAVTSLQLADCAILHLILPSSLPLVLLQTLDGRLNWLNLAQGNLAADIRQPSGTRFACCAVTTAGQPGDSPGVQFSPEERRLCISYDATAVAVYAVGSSDGTSEPASRLNTATGSRAQATPPASNPGTANPGPANPSSSSATPAAANPPDPASSAGAATPTPPAAPAGSILVYDMPAMEHALLPEAFDLDNGTPMMITRMLAEPFSPAPSQSPGSSMLRPRSLSSAGAGPGPHRRSHSVVGFVPRDTGVHSSLSAYGISPSTPDVADASHRALRVSISSVSPSALQELRTLSGSMRREPRETGDSYASNPRPVRLAGLEAGGSRSAGLDGDVRCSRSTSGLGGLPQERRRSTNTTGHGRKSSQGGPVNDAETGTQDGKSTVFSMAQTLSAPKGALDPQALSRVMAKISSRNGGRKLRERKIQKHMAELADRCLKESNAKPSLMI